MMITALSNDVSKKKEFWKLFAVNNNCIFKYKRTPNREVNILNLMCIYKKTQIFFKESDAKPLTCEFEMKINDANTITIREITFLDKIFSKLKKSERHIDHPFINKYKISSKNKKVINALLNDNNLLDLMYNSEFYGLYSYRKNGLLNIIITATYFVNNYRKLSDIYSIASKIIEYLLLYS